ncbi:MAG: GNAT family N-acetyltransferase [Candidatus Bipolaricaulota bacterium]|nr:GNAT family N-acetyltransferase [Candidatus Bipolaricaulota bacterium]
MELRGERLRLREFRATDLAQTRRWVADPQIARWILPAWPLLPASWDAWLQRVYTSPDSRHFAIVLHDGRHIGNVSLHSIRWQEGVAEVGIVLGEKDCWGQGYGPEALRLLVRYAFEELGLKKLVLHVHRENVRALRAYRKVGFREVGAPWPLRVLRAGIVTMALEAPVREGVP